MDMRLVLPFALLLATAPLAGCLELFGGDTGSRPDISLARVLTVTVEPGAYEDGETPELADLMETHLEVVVVDGSWDASGLSVEYTDTDGAAQTAAVSDFTTRSTLRAGDRVAIPDADIQAPSRLVQGADVLSARSARAGSSWTVQGVPIGFGADPGSSLRYDMRAATSAEFGLRGLTTPEFTLDRFEYSAGWNGAGTLTMDAGALTATGPFGPGVPSAFSFEMEGAFPVRVSGAGEMNGSEVEAGVVFEDTRFDVSAAATFWVSELGALQGVEPGAAAFDADADVVMWSTGGDEAMMEDMDCAGESRADRCEPQWAKDTFPLHEEQTGGGPEPVPDEPLDEDDREAADMWTAFLAQGLAVGDAVHVVVHGDADDFGGLSDGSTGSVELRYDAEVIRLVDATVGAGSYQAHELVSTVTLEAESGGIDVDGDEVLGSFDLAETLQRTTMLFDAGSQLLLRLEQSSPADAQRIFDTLLDGFSPPDDADVEGPESVTASSDNRFEIELSSVSGRAEMSPLFAFVLFQGAPLAGVGAFGIPLRGFPFGGMESHETVPYPVGCEPPAMWDPNQTEPSGMPPECMDWEGPPYGYECPPDAGDCAGFPPPQGGEDASVRATTADGDADGLDDHLTILLVRGDNAPYSADYNESEMGINVFSDHGFYGLGWGVCTALPVDGMCPSEAQTFGSPGGDMEWDVGETLYVPCAAAEPHHVSVVLRGTIIFTGELACREANGEALP